MAVGALLLFGVVGWGVVQLPHQNLPILPTVAPELPVEKVAVEKGSLVVETQPWGEVVRVATTQGEEMEVPQNAFTPLQLELAPGLYRIEIMRPGLEQPKTCEVSVESQVTTTCEVQLTAVRSSDLFKRTGWWQ